MARSALANGEQQPLQRSVVLGVCLYLCASPGVTLGQATEESVDEIVVVGTHIRQVDPDGPSPVTIFDRDALERTGAPTVARAMHRLPFGNDGSFNDSDAFSTALGGSGISFRGLGANAVLILINGRRVAPYGFSFQSDTLISFVDLNSIPIGAVERIEILKDGASAIYGSDAIAGVVNIVLREDMTGIEIEARAGAPSESGAEEVGINAIWGHTSERTNIELIANYSNREALLWRDRDISKTADFSNRGGTDQRALQSTNFQINDTWAAYGAECDERAGTISGVQDFELLESGTCIYDPNSVIAEPSVERVGLMAILNR
jgi:outer membrane cobalamin receptor